MHVHSDALARTAALEAIFGSVTDIRKLYYFHKSEKYENQALLLTHSQPTSPPTNHPTSWSRHYW